MKGAVASSGPPWVYASLAAAEASGDSWANGVDVTITGGAVFVYYTSLAVDGYSGLIHKYPYDGTGTLGTISSTTVKNSTAAGVDPDTWTGWTKAVESAGVADTNGGRSRLIAPTTLDKVTMTSDNAPGTTDLVSFIILDAISAGFTGTDSTGIVPYSSSSIHARRADDVSNVGLALQLTRVRSTTRWDIEHGANTLTSKAAATEARVWMYVKDGRWAVWFDDDATPEVSGATPGFTLPTFSELYADSAAVTTNVFQKLNQTVLGVMVTA